MFPAILRRIGWHSFSAQLARAAARSRSRRLLQARLFVSNLNGRRSCERVDDARGVVDRHSAEVTHTGRRGQRTQQQRQQRWTAKAKRAQAKERTAGEERSSQRKGCTPILRQHARDGGDWSLADLRCIPTRRFIRNLALIHRGGRSSTVDVDRVLDLEMVHEDVRELD
jgi:hypothetical protein